MYICYVCMCGQYFRKCENLSVFKCFSYMRFKCFFINVFFINVLYNSVFILCWLFKCGPQTQIVSDFPNLVFFKEK